MCRVSSNPEIITGHSSPLPLHVTQRCRDRSSIAQAIMASPQQGTPATGAVRVGFRSPHSRPPRSTRGNHGCHQSNHNAPAWLASTTRPSRRILLAFKIALPVQVSTPGSGQRCRDKPRSICRKPGPPSPSVGRRSGTPRSLAANGKSCRPRRQRSSKWIATAVPPQ